MSRRPTSVTVIAWILIGMNLLGAFGYVAATIRHRPSAKETVFQSRIPVAVRQVVGFGGMTIGFVCGYFMLQGRNWARLLYVIWTPIQFIFDLVAWPAWFTITPGVIVFLVIAYFLFRAKANAFFAEGSGNFATQNMPSTRRVVSIFFYVLAGFFFSCTCLMAFAWSPGELAKWLVLSFQSLPAAICLSIGRVLSPERRWAREAGIVLISASASGAFLVLTMALMFMEPEFQKRAPPEKLSFFNDYFTGILWIAGMGAMGGILLSFSRKQLQSPPRGPRIPIIGR